MLKQKIMTEAQGNRVDELLLVGFKHGGWYCDLVQLEHKGGLREPLFVDFVYPDGTLYSERVIPSTVQA